MMADRTRVEVTKLIDAARQAVKMRRDEDAIPALEEALSALRQHVEAVAAPTIPPGAEGAEIDVRFSFA